MSTTNFFFKDGEINQFTIDYFTTAFRNANYRISKLKVDATILQRMEVVSLSYNFNFVLTKNGKTFAIEDFDEHSDLSSINDTFRTEFSQILEDWKKAAVDRKSKIVIQHNDSKVESKIDNECKTERVITVKEDVYENKFFVKISKTPNILDILFTEQFMRMWGDYVIKDGVVVINNKLVFKNLCVDGMSAKFEFKLKEWVRYCVVSVSVRQDSNTVVCFDVKDSVFKSDTAMRTLWIELVFHRIVPLFNIALL